MFGLHFYRDRILLDQFRITDGQIPFLAYEKCIFCDTKRNCVNGWVSEKEGEIE
jgi:hypothetical protein